jgi:hypothetical protein
MDGGKALKQLREQVVIATKFGFDIEGSQGGFARQSRSNPDHICKVIEGSLWRLQTDYVGSTTSIASIPIRRWRTWQVRSMTQEAHIPKSDNKRLSDRS